MENSENDFQNLFNLAKEIKMLSGINQLLDWDMETYMPIGAVAIRGEQIETLTGIIHELKTGRKFTKALEKLIDIKTKAFKVQTLTDDQKIALKEWTRDYIQEKSLPKKFVKAFAKLTSQAISAWREAKKNNTFHIFQPFLEKIISMERKKAKYLGFKDHPYDALLDLYEPGMTTKDIERQFASLKIAVNALLARIAKKKQLDDSFIQGTFSHEKQIAFCKKILTDIGFDFQYGRLDFSTHPFSSASHPTDSRITTRIHKTSLVNCISTVLHEAGHALYEMGLPQEYYGSPLCEAVSLGIHESQSRFFETRIGQSKPFWKPYFPLLSKEFPEKLQDISLEMFYNAINKVEASLIRVDADEVTYSLHVILRFEIEKGLIEGSIKVKDIPKIWKQKMKDLLGVEPKNDTEGCLQDIHWAMGGFGYFPTYTLGNLYAAHLFEAFALKHKDFEARMEKGDFTFIRNWLHDNIHKQGKRFSSQDLLKNVTGKEFSADAYIRYLDQKYEAIYSI